jgi:chemotaxis protein histidine kinase CheA
MRTRRTFVLLAANAFVCAFLAYGQDSQSLGDVARQARVQKQQKDAQAKDTPAKDVQRKDAQGSGAVSKDAQPPKPPRVITNDEIPSHVGSTMTSAPGSQTPNTRYSQPTYGTQKIPAEQWQSQIQNQKNAIASLQREIASLSESIHYAGGNCVANCVQWNERQKEKEDQVESMKAQLEQQQKRLEDLQDAARKQGFGSSVYDP